MGKIEGLVNVATLSVEEYEKAAKIWSEGYKNFEEILSLCLNNGLPTIACCKGHHVSDSPYMTFIYNKNTRKMINAFLNDLQKVKGVQIMFSSTGFTDNPFNVTVYSNMFNRDKVFNTINNSLKNRQQSDQLYSKLNAALRLTLNLDYTDLGTAHITLYNRLFHDIFSVKLNGMFLQSDLFDEYKSYSSSPLYIYRSDKQLDIISDDIEKVHELFQIGNFELSAFATPEQKADGIADYNNEREELFGTISRSKL